MSVEMNGIAHIQLTVNDPERCIPFWEKLCHFLSMKTLIKGEGVLYCRGNRTGGPLGPGGEGPADRYL